MRDVHLNPANGQITLSPARPRILPVQGVLDVDVDQLDSDVRRYKFHLPYLPPSKNEFDGWKHEWKSGAKRKWVRDITRKVEEFNIPEASKIGLAAVLVFPTNRQRDPQNYSNCLWHWVPDALQQAGVIRGDHEGMIELGSNWGIKFAVDTSTAPAAKKKRTHLSLVVRVKP